MKSEGALGMASSEGAGGATSSPMINIPADIVKEFKTNSCNGVAHNGSRNIGSPMQIHAKMQEHVPSARVNSPKTDMGTSMGLGPGKTGLVLNANVSDVPAASFDKFSDASILSKALSPAVPSSQLTELTSAKYRDAIESVVKAKENEDPEKKQQKRTLSSDDEALDSKRFKTATPVDPVSLTSGSNDQPDLVNKLSKTNPALKLRKVKRKDLEMIIMTLFRETLLYKHDLGKYKDLCEGLESSLDHHRKKSTQYFKELDDLRKITGRLQDEHNARKDTLSFPIKIKRSVGVQAAPLIINRAYQNAAQQMKGVKIISPSPSVLASLKNPAGSALSHTGTQPQNAATFPGNNGKTYANAVTSNLPNNTESGRRYYVKQSPNTVTTGVQCTQQSSIINKQKAVPFNSMAANRAKTFTTAAPRNNNDLIDLTDEEEARGQKSIGRPVQSSTGYVPIKSANPNTVSAARPVNGAVASTSNGTAKHQHQAPHLHPAPLPTTAVQQVAGVAKSLPPQPILKLSHKDNSIVLSWTMTKTEEHEVIASYQLYAYQESSQKPTSTLWKKVGSVKALELPMACTLTQFMPGHRYHFAVRAVDSKNRVGAFSEPRSIILERSN